MPHPSIVFLSSLHADGDAPKFHALDVFRPIVEAIKVFVVTDKGNRGHRASKALHGIVFVAR